MKTKHMSEFRGITERFEEFKSEANQKINQLLQEKASLEQDKAVKEDQINRLKQDRRSTSHHHEKTLKNQKEKVEKLQEQLKAKEDEGKR